MAAPRADEHAVFDRFVTIYETQYPKATDTLKKDSENLLLSYDFPAEHWQNLRTTDAIESTIGTVRYRNMRTFSCAS